MRVRERVYLGARGAGGDLLGPVQQLRSRRQTPVLPNLDLDANLAGRDAERPQLTALLGLSFLYGDRAGAELVCTSCVRRGRVGWGGWGPAASP